jgi:hypothetical protein
LSSRHVADPQLSNADPDPPFHFDADPNLDPTFHFYANPDLTFYFDADRDPTPYLRNKNLRPLAHRPSTALWAFTALYGSILSLYSY